MATTALQQVKRFPWATKGLLVRIKGKALVKGKNYKGKRLRITCVTRGIAPF